MNLILKKLIKLTNLPYVLKMQQKKRQKILLIYNFELIVLNNRELKMAK